MTLRIMHIKTIKLSLLHSHTANSKQRTQHFMTYPAHHEFADGNTIKMSMEMPNKSVTIDE